jgi:hypothetical protein
VKKAPSLYGGTGASGGDRDEAGKYLPFDSMDEVNFDFQVLGQNEYNPNQIDVIIVAAKKDIVEAYWRPSRWPACQR